MLLYASGKWAGAVKTITIGGRLWQERKPIIGLESSRVSMEDRGEIAVGPGQ
jgi:hypothetical protein